MTAWIPVSERLPEDCTEVIISINVFGIRPRTTAGYYRHFDGRWLELDESYAVVSAWMPLPEPYQPSHALEPIARPGESAD